MRGILIPARQTDLEQQTLKPHEISSKHLYTIIIYNSLPDAVDARWGIQRGVFLAAGGSLEAAPVAGNVGCPTNPKARR